MYLYVPDPANHVPDLYICCSFSVIFREKLIVDVKYVVYIQNSGSQNSTECVFIVVINLTASI